MKKISTLVLFALISVLSLSAQITLNGKSCSVDTIMRRQIGPGIVQTIVRVPEYPLNAYVLEMDMNNPFNAKIDACYNPIILGETIDEKTCVLDLHIRLNNDEFINIEMQVTDWGDWPERSITYLCRSFDQLHRSESYADIHTTIHIGIVDFNFNKYNE